MEENENNNNNDQTRLFCDHGHEINEADDDEDVRQCTECAVNVKKGENFFSCNHREINLQGNDIFAVILCENCYKNNINPMIKYNKYCINNTSNDNND
eukprot:72603_1